MDYVPRYRQEQTVSNNNLILDVKLSDVNGDNIVDDVQLIGDRKEDEIVINNIRIMIRDGKNNNEKYIALKVNKGYEPHLFLGDFTHDNVSDILVSIQSGNTGREGYLYIYSFVSNMSKLLFDFEEFNNEYKYDVIYENNYIIKVIRRSNGKQFKIDISNREEDYLSRIYNSDGNLKKPLKGMVSPLLELRPIKNREGKNYDLMAIQRVIGYYNADTLGMIETPLKWNGRAFTNVNNSYLILSGTDTAKI